MGRNFPCTQLPSSTPVGSETSIWGFSGTDFEKDTDVVLSFLVRCIFEYIFFKMKIKNLVLSELNQLGKR